MTVENLKDFDRTLFGTKIVNFNTQKLGLILYTWTNVYADAHIPFATCVDENGKKIQCINGWHQSNWRFRWRWTSRIRLKGIRR